MDVYPEKIENTRVEISYKNIERLIGKFIDKDTIHKILGLLDMVIRKEEGDILLLEIPAYRVDVKLEADVIEEILRIYGYNNVEIDSHVNSTLTYIERPDKENVINIISDLLSANGFAEIMCNSLVPAWWFEQSGDFNTAQLVRLANPLSSDLNAMRQSLLYGGLNSVIWNINRQCTDLKFYEFGNCYFKVNSEHPVPLVNDYNEKTSLDLFITGKTGKENWNHKTNPTDFFHIKSATEMVLSRLGINASSLSNGESSMKYFAESITYMFNNSLVAETGRISKSYLAKFDIGQDVFYSHLEWDNILRIIKNNSISYSELPKYPSVRRDLAILLDKKWFGQIKR
jgi:phenylalanyl-tRNA synthetase beta chain